ncbi:unnamed protein product [Polarella glacialis]|uniref:Amidohydrolase-related domain-containing protein n=1 Tax=Polarella glacialis TaxID=89957 RepID=A0A813JVM5_POLGL|nr:unnamed protein product [Polarella glacialis]|eukprot:CAMPEP_0115062358 /NCGR_PEP_ID=MMETSP0227-20121206/8497_1 /TAXON_ID=89957 /ORGANISM="Polarella glacialis, Strain CCMP 1383" /LENGTH=297 /DNA_ID=CAMNT_0002447719 /DNA_START=45 /DNA_END=938 /DNA_ORIENTATION=+
MPAQRVIDAHIHLAVQWRDGESGLPNPALSSMPPSWQRDWSEQLLLEFQAGSADKYKFEGSVFIECMHESPSAEAKWVLEMCRDSRSSIMGCVAHVPVPDGTAAVEDMLAELRDSEGRLPPELKGGRVVLLGPPMPADDACLSESYLAGLRALEAAGLPLWEWCCCSSALRSVAEASSKFPKMTFVLDHLGHNGSGEDFEAWAPALEQLAENQNVVAKLGAIEQWGTSDPGKFLDFAIKVFGPGRVMAESNWFVNTSLGDTYEATFDKIMASCKRLELSPEDIDAVFYGNAKRVYSL